MKRYKKQRQGIVHSLPPFYGFTMVAHKERMLWLLLHAAIKEGHDLSAGAVIVGAEGGCGGTGGHTVLHGPQDCIAAVSFGSNIGEGIHRIS